MDTITEPIFYLAYALPVLCCFCYGSMLVCRRESRTKRMQGVMMLMSSLCFAASLVYDAMEQQNGRVPVLNVWHMGSLLMMCPFINWYFLVLIRPDARFFPRHFYLLIPFFLSIVCSLLFLKYAPRTPHAYSSGDFIALLDEYPEAMYRIVLVAVFLAEIIYITVNTELALKTHRKQFKNDFSYSKNVNLNWVQIPIGLSLVACCLNLVYAFTALVELRTLYSIIFFMVIVTFCVYAGTHPDIYYVVENTDQQTLRKCPDHAVLFIPPDIDRPKISHLMYDKIYSGIKDLLERQEVFCKPNLRLDDLAEQLNTNKTYVSMVINGSYHTNFYTLINQYRVKKAVCLLEDTHLQIKDVWIISGFNSQTTFNSIFKKEMNMTPSEWIRRANCCAFEPQRKIDC